jgi:AraC-like DNA-binding protein
MGQLASTATQGLERSCEARDFVRAGASRAGFERVEVNLRTVAFAPHRHDSYAIGVTLRGVQSFGYRGTTEVSPAGHAFVIHPDEKHDGRPATDEGFHYRIVYVAPDLIGAALDGRRLPFAREAVTREMRLHRAICVALDAFDAAIEDVQFDQVIAGLADALVSHDPAPRSVYRVACQTAVRLARDYLDANLGQPVSSGALERTTGLSRFALARHFRDLVGTSPYRYLVMRRLERAKRLIVGGSSLAQAAAASGFADQSHMTRQFKQAYGVSPGQWRALVS